MGTARVRYGGAGDPSPRRGTLAPGGAGRATIASHRSGSGYSGAVVPSPIPPMNTATTETTETAARTAAPPAGADPISLAAVGDILLHARYGQAAAAGRAGALLGGLTGLLSGCDLAVGNMETVLTRDGTPRADKLCLDGDPAWAAALADAGLGLVTLANNHCLDFGPAGLADTRRHLAAAGLAAIGAGTDLADAWRPWVAELRGIRIGFLAACHVSTRPGALAGPETPGVAPLAEDGLMAAIDALKPRVDHVVLLLHWGLEYSHYPTPEQVALAHAAIDRGASAILGHHSHSLQGIETYRGGVIAYSLANLTDAPVDWQGPTRHYRCDLGEVDRESVLLKLRIWKDRVELAETVPLWLDDDGAPTAATGARAEKIRGDLAAYSARLDPDDLAAYWRSTVMDSRVAGPLASWWRDGSLWDKVRRFRPGQLVTAWILVRTWARLRFSRAESRWELFSTRNDTRPMPSAQRRGPDDA